MILLLTNLLWTINSLCYTSLTITKGQYYLVTKRLPLAQLPHFLLTPSQFEDEEIGRPEEIIVKKISGCRSELCQAKVSSCLLFNLMFDAGDK